MKIQMISTRCQNRAAFSSLIGVFGTHRAAGDHHRDDRQDGRADQHVQAVQGQGRVVEAEEEHLPVAHLRQVRRAGVDPLADLVGPLEVMVEQKQPPHHDGDQQQDHGQPAPAAAQGGQGQGGAVASRQQDHRVGGAEPEVELPRRGVERLGEVDPVDGIEQEQAAEHHDFGEQKEPHAASGRDLGFDGGRMAHGDSGGVSKT